MDLAYDHTTLLKRHVFWTDVAHTYHHHSWVAKVGGPWVQDQPWLPSEFWATMDLIRFCLQIPIFFLKGGLSSNLHVQVLTLGIIIIKIHFFNLMAEWGDQVNQRFPLVKPQESHWCHPVLARNAGKEDPWNGCSLLFSVARAWAQSLSHISSSLSPLENSGRLENGDRDTALVSTCVSQYKDYQSCGYLTWLTATKT